MKKLLLLTFGLMLCALTFAQLSKGTVHLSQDFSSPFPLTGWTIENYTTKWTSSSTANAGGTAPELKFTYTSGTLTTRFISPVVDLSGVENLVFSFKHFVDHYGPGYTVGAATRSNSGTWNTIWSVTPTEDVGPELVDIIVSNSDVGSSTFQICFFLSGNAYQIDYWYIDDVELYTPMSEDISIYGINAPDYYAQGDMSIGAEVKNVGLTTLTSFDASYQIDEGDIVTQSFSGLNVGQTNTYSLTFDQVWAATPGSYSLKVWVSNMNGNGDDDDTDNDSKTKTLNIASQTTPNLPLFESFTSSTCPPCATFNGTIFNSFLTNNINNLAIIKYQMNWPGNGDPYYNSDGGTRRVYYGVSAVPDLYAGGNSITLSANELSSQLSSLGSKDAYFDISINATYVGTNITAKIDVSPYITASGLKIHAAVLEKETTGNVGSNGETSFKYVMMKMLPNGNGTSVDFVDGEQYSVTLTSNLASTFIEQYSDLAIVVFIQNDSNKEIFQSKMANVTEGSTGITGSLVENISVYPNPTSGRFTVKLPVENGFSVIEIYSASGTLLYSNNITSINQDFDLGLQKGIYIISVTTITGEKLTQKLVVR